MNDTLMADTVFEVLLESYTKPRKELDSVEQKAAAWISIEQLQDAWKELKKYKISQDTEKAEHKQIGL